MVLVILHPDADSIALFEEGRFGFPVEDGFHCAHFSQTGIAHPTRADRFAGATICPAIRNGARADYRSGAQAACLGGVRNELGNSTVTTGTPLWTPP